MNLLLLPDPIRSGDSSMRISLIASVSLCVVLALGGCAAEMYDAQKSASADVSGELALGPTAPIPGSIGSAAAPNVPAAPAAPAAAPPAEPRQVIYSAGY